MQSSAAAAASARASARPAALMPKRPPLTPRAAWAASTASLSAPLAPCAFAPAERKLHAGIGAALWARWPSAPWGCWPLPRLPCPPAANGQRPRSCPRATSPGAARISPCFLQARKASGTLRPAAQAARPAWRPVQARSWLLSTTAPDCCSRVSASTTAFAGPRAPSAAKSVLRGPSSRSRLRKSLPFKSGMPRSTEACAW